MLEEGSGNLITLALQCQTLKMGGCSFKIVSQQHDQPGSSRIPDPSSCQCQQQHLGDAGPQQHRAYTRLEIGEPWRGTWLHARKQEALIAAA